MAKNKPEAGLARGILCPTCLNEFDWDADPNLYEMNGEPIQQIDDEPEVLRRDRELGAWKRCPTPPLPDEQHHLLPVRYGQYGRPMVIGFVGGGNAGKSHLLATIVRELEGNALDALGARADVLDHDLHDEYVLNSVNPLFDEGLAVPPTPPVTDEAARFRDAFLISYGNESRPVAFFDVAGDVLTARRIARASHFLLAVDALIVVVDWDRDRRRRGFDS